MPADGAKIIRVWRTEVDPERIDEYIAFTQSESLPMFRSQAGFLGVFFAHGGTEHVAITLWQDRTSAEALVSSQSYLSTVHQIEAKGFLAGEQALAVYDVDAYASSAANASLGLA